MKNTSRQLNAIAFLSIFLTIFFLHVHVSFAQGPATTAGSLKQVEQLQRPLEEGDFHSVYSQLESQFGDDLDPFKEAYTLRENTSVWSSISKKSGLHELFQDLVKDGEFDEVTYKKNSKIVQDKLLDMVKENNLLTKLKQAQVAAELIKGIHQMRSRTQFNEESKEQVVQDGNKGQEGDEDSSSGSDGEGDGDGDGDGDGEEEEVESDLDQDQDKHDDQKEKGDKSDGKQQKKKQKSKKKPWDQPADQYIPRNKDMEQNNDKESLKSVLISTNAPVKSPLMRDAIFDMVQSKRWAKHSLARKEKYEEISDGEIYDYKVTTFKQNFISLPVPKNYIPKSKDPSAARVIQKYAGEFVLEILGDKIPEEISLDLVPIRYIIKPGMDQQIRREYLSATGIDKEIWPEEILKEVQALQLDTKLTDADRIKKMTEFIHKNFTYYSKDSLGEEKKKQVDEQIVKLKESMPTPVAMAHAKALQCDGAAWVLSALGRDFFNVPTRISSGRTAVRRKTEEGNRVVVRAADPKHAWVEYWVNGKGWMDIDPTPPQGSSDKEHKEDDKEPSDDSSQSDSPMDDDGSDSKSQASDGDEHGEGSVKDKGEGEEHKDKESEEKDGKGGKEGKDGKEDKSKSKKEEEASEGDTDLTIGEDAAPLIKEITEQLKIERIQEDPYIKMILIRMIKDLAMVIGNPKLKLEMIQKLEKFKEEITNPKKLSYIPPETKKTIAVILRMLEGETSRLKEIKTLLTRNRGDGATLMEAYQQSLKENEFDQVYNYLISTKMDMEFLEKIKHLTEKEQKYKTYLLETLSLLDSIKHENSLDYNLVKQFLRSLPGPISRGMVRSNYSLTAAQLGDENTNRLARDLKAGHLQDLESTCVIAEKIKQDAIHTYEKEKIDLFIGAVTPQVQKVKREVKVTSALDICKVRVLGPLAEMVAKFAADDLYRNGYKLPCKVDDPRGRKKHIETIFLEDQSGSMKSSAEGAWDFKRTQFVQRYLSTFLDKVRQENLNKNVVHNVSIIPFNDVVHQVMAFGDDASASEYYRKHLKGNAPIVGNGTNIQHALITAYKQIAENFANDPVGLSRHFNIANVVLITDGNSPMDIDAIKEMIATIPEGVKISLKVVLIGTNESTCVDTLLAAEICKKDDIEIISDLQAKELFNAKVLQSERKKFHQFATDRKFNALPSGLLAKLERFAEKTTELQKIPTSRLSTLGAMGAGGPSQRNTSDFKDIKKTGLDFSRDMTVGPQRDSTLEFFLETAIPTILEFMPLIPRDEILQSALSIVKDRASSHQGKLHPLTYKALCDFLSSLGKK